MKLIMIWFNKLLILNKTKIDMENKNILSLFDGMSGGQIALNRADIKYDNYFSSEIDKFAIWVTQENYPDTIQLGDIRKIKAKDLPKIDLLIGGSPCQGFSFAGKQLNFDDERSKLFFEYVRILNEIKKINPNVKFLLENVNMKRKYLGIISEYLGLFPVNLNSNLISAQNRNRWYWTNVRTKKVGLFEEIYSDIPLPKDKGILLKDILQPESEVDKKYYLGEKTYKFLKNYAKKRGQNFNLNAKDGKGKCLTVSHLKTNLETNYVKVNSDMDIIATYRHSFEGFKGYKNKSPTIKGSGGSGNDILIQLKEISSYQGDKIHYDNEKMQCLSAQGGNKLRGIGYSDGHKLRRLTPIECERLQTVPDNYTSTISDTQRYKMLGNGFTVDMIAHILKQQNR